MYIHNYTHQIPVPMFIFRERNLDRDRNVSFTGSLTFNLKIGNQCIL